MTDAIDRVIEFIGSRDPEFVRQIRGAAAEEIDRLERAMNRSVPDLYRQFLERMGRSVSWLKLADARFDIDSLIKYYEHYGVPDPEGYFLIGRANGDPNYDVYLWVERPDRLRVVSFPPPPRLNFATFASERIRRLAGSLPQLIGDRALAVFCNHRMPHHRQVEDLEGRSASRLGQLDALLDSRDVMPVWYSNDWMRTYESPEVLVTAYEVPGRLRLIVDVRTATEEEFNRIYPPIRDLVKGPR